MKIAICGDVHMTQYSSILRSHGKKYSTRLENCIESLNWFEKVSIENNCDREIFLGDFFDAPTLDAETITALEEVQWNKIQKYFIVGNHEMGSADLSINSLNILSTIGEVITEPTNDTLGTTNCNILFLPYILECNRKELKEYLYSKQEGERNIIFSHNDLQCQYGQYKSSNGFMLDEIETNCDLFINGHIHNFSKINNKIINLGILTGLNFSEDANKYSHNIMILETSTMEYQIIENPFAFNFYKLNEMNEILCVDKGNAIGSINIKEDELKEAHNLCDLKFLTYRIITTPVKKEKETQEKININDVDHIEKFKNYIRERLGQSSIIEEELMQF